MWIVGTRLKGTATGSSHHSPDFALLLDSTRSKCSLITLYSRVNIVQTITQPYVIFVRTFKLLYKFLYKFCVTVVKKSIHFVGYAKLGSNVNFF